MEKILCAAIHYNDGNEHFQQPLNIKKGYVICGYRHSNCITIFSIIVGFPYDEYAIKLRNSQTQGFLTSENRFVSREEASMIAFDSGQITDLKVSLYSEDLY